jgi:hypothetical protein
MAKTIGALGGSAAPLDRKQFQHGLSISTFAQRIALFFRHQNDLEIEHFIQKRGGVFNDEMERAISRHLGKTSHWE